MDIAEDKMKSLLIQYRRDTRKVAETKKYGGGADDIKAPKRFAYRLLTFLEGINKRMEGNFIDCYRFHVANWCPVSTL